MPLTKTGSKIAARALFTSLLLVSSSAFAQEAVVVDPVTPVSPAPVEATAQPVAPAPIVNNTPAQSDRVAPQAAAEAAAERTERSQRAAAPAAAPVRQAAVRPRPAASAVAAPTDAIAPDAPVSAEPVSDIPATAAPVETAVAPTPVGSEGNVASSIDSDDNEWLFGAGIAAALGLAGLGLLASRRRRRPEKVATRRGEPMMAANDTQRSVNAETPKAAPVAAPAFVAASADPLFTRPRHDMPVAKQPVRDASTLPGVTDPLFSLRPEQVPVTDPMFARKVDVPPITDPMFAKHPEYQGNRTDKTSAFSWGEKPVTATPAPSEHRPMEPAE